MADKKFYDQLIREKALSECLAMAEHAMANGKQVSPAVMQVVEKLQTYELQGLHPNDPVVNTRAAAYVATSNNEDETALMAQLAYVHNELSQSVLPATPESVRKLQIERNSGGILRGLGQVSLVRKMNAIVIICLLLFVWLFASDRVDSKSITGNILDYPLWDFIYNQTFLISMAALGACFFGLFEAYKYLTDGTYDSKYESIYWIRFTLGLVSGIVLALFLEPVLFGLENTPDSMKLFTKPILAFLGGFSARVVYRILTRLVESLETFVDGSAKDVIEAREKMARVKLDQEIDKMRQTHSANMSQDKLNMAMRLMQAKEQLAQGMSQGDMKNFLDDLLQESMNTALPSDNKNPPAFIYPAPATNPVVPPPVNPNPPLYPPITEVPPPPSNSKPDDFGIELPDFPMDMDRNNPPS